jgi:hypothetical protein
MQCCSSSNNFADFPDNEQFEIDGGDAQKNCACDDFISENGPLRAGSAQSECVVFMATVRSEY